MRFAPLTILAAFAAAVSAQSPNPFNINGPIQITAGQPYTIKWNPTTQGPVSLTLRSGASSDLNSGSKIASGIDNSGSYTFTLPADTVRNSDYTIQISSDGNPSQVNYTPQFVVESKNTVASQSSASGSASATAKSTATGSSASTASTATTSGASTATGSATSTATTARASSVTRSSASAASATSSVAAAPTNAACNLQAQGGLAALMIGAAALL